MMVNSSSSREKISTSSNLNIKTQDITLPDKVYTFTAPTDTLTFNSLYLNKDYNYHIWIELVTPHNCTMRIRIWDPENKQYNIFESDMFYEPDYGRYFEIPFGTTMSGDYMLEFYVETDQNLNIYIRIEQGVKCLYEKVPAEDLNGLIFYEVKRFTNGMHIEHDVYLETDKMYKYYIGRVSAISILESNVVRMDYIIEDPNGVEFDIYTNVVMESIDGINSFSFGTAIGGVYTIKLTISCSVSYVNIGYLVIDDYQIDDVIDVNDTDSEGSQSNQGIGNNNTYLPTVWTLGTFIFIGGLALILTVVFVEHRKKNTVNLDLNDKRK